MTAPLHLTWDDVPLLHSYSRLPARLPRLYRKSCPAAPPSKGYGAKPTAALRKAAAHIRHEGKGNHGFKHRVTESEQARVRLRSGNGGAGRCRGRACGLRARRDQGRRRERARKEGRAPTCLPTAPTSRTGSSMHGPIDVHTVIAGGAIAAVRVALTTTRAASWAEHAIETVMPQRMASRPSASTPTPSPAPPSPASAIERAVDDAVVNAGRRPRRLHRLRGPRAHAPDGCREERRRRHRRCRPRRPHGRLGWPPSRARASSSASAWATPAAARPSPAAASTPRRRSIQRAWGTRPGARHAQRHRTSTACRYCADRSCRGRRQPLLRPRHAVRRARILELLAARAVDTHAQASALAFCPIGDSRAVPAARRPATSRSAASTHMQIVDALTCATQLRRRDHRRRSR